MKRQMTASMNRFQDLVYNRMFQIENEEYETRIPVTQKDSR